MPVKPLTFKGDKSKTKKRKRVATDDDPENAPSSKQLATTSSKPQNEETPDDDSWVSADVPSDITGPVLIVLPTDVPSALVSDAFGKVFTLEIENLIEGDPSTSEPHDLRQVWIANRVAGTETFTFKAGNKKYLGCDKEGVLAASQNAITPEERWSCIPIADNPGTFALQTQREGFLTVVGNEEGSAKAEVKGNSEDINFSSTLRIRMQARYKPKLKAKKEDVLRQKISRKELEEMVGKRLDDDQVRMLKKAKREGNFHEKLLDVKVKSKHDKFA
ncbi:actin-crosslinking protein [Aulographum hederae CBS 113979]|uniref:Actin-crosslinking protein n=1 Tax=Aulographum hederae CBS 113979 TaxID=1176131 RepID=A0A6G1H5T8_9PEZI|nr:actin-crosslinking protein [Aulographum hederae CBS 113979]